jgi:hypothetical protein
MQKILVCPSPGAKHNAANDQLLLFSRACRSPGFDPIHYVQINVTSMVDGLQNNKNNNQKPKRVSSSVSG